jgi:hypothetical protein
VVRAISDEWYPMGDNAFFSLRARDVFTEHHPFLGTWTSASLSVGENVNNPGPLLFDLFAIPARIDHVYGAAVGAAALNIAAVVLVAAFARRLAGSAGVAVLMAVAAMLGWSLGSELLFDPWQPHSLVFPFLAYLVLVWATAAGDRLALPIAVGVGSLLVQTHLSYALLVPVLGLYAVVRLVVRLRTEAVSEGERRSLSRVLMWSTIVGLVCWAQPLAEQLTEPKGNLGRLLGNVGGADDTLGLADGASVLTSVLAEPPFWGRPSFRDTLAPAAVLPSAGAATVEVIMLFAAAAAVWLWARRRRDTPVGAAAETIGVALVVGLTAAATLPLGVFGLAAHQFRWLWPVGAMSVALVALAVIRAAPRRPRRVGIIGTLAIAGVASVATLPHWNPELGPAAEADGTAAAHELASQLGELPPLDTVLFETENLPFAEAFSTVVMLELDRRGVEFVVDDDAMVRQLGDRRRFDGAASHRVVVLYGTEAIAGLEGAERVAFVEGIDAGEQRELEELEPQIVALLGAGDLELTERGRKARRDGDVADLETPHDEDEVAALLATSEVGRAVLNGWVELDGDSGEVLSRHSRLQHRRDRHTVGVFLEPLGP